MEENQKVEQQDEEKEEVETDESEESESSGKSFLAKEIAKYRRKVKKGKSATTKYLLAAQQVLLFAILIIVFISWPLIEKGLQFLSGVETVYLVSKTEKNGCFEVVTEEGETYCVDEESYLLVDVQGEYKLQEQQHEYKLRR